MDQHASPDRITPLQSEWSVALSAMTEFLNLFMQSFGKKYLTWTITVYTIYTSQYIFLKCNVCNICPKVCLGKVNILSCKYCTHCIKNTTKPATVHHACAYRVNKHAASKCNDCMHSMFTFLQHAYLLCIRMVFRHFENVLLERES